MFVKEKMIQHARAYVLFLKAAKNRTITAVILLILIQFIWIIALQYQVCTLSSQAHIQQTRIAQLEQSDKKHNNLLYYVAVTMNDIEKKWHDLNFRVLENTWKLAP